MKDIDTFVQF